MNALSFCNLVIGCVEVENVILLKSMTINKNKNSVEQFLPRGQLACIRC